MEKISLPRVGSCFNHGERLSKVVDKTIVDVKAALSIYHYIIDNDSGYFVMEEPL